MPDLDAAARLGRPADQQAELLLLHDVAYAGTPIPGERAHALLALLALSGGAGVADDDLVRDVWPDRQPVNPRKALQVLVSRVRAHTARGLVERVGDGYRLAAAASRVDAFVLQSLVDRAARAEDDGDVAAAAELAAGARAIPVGRADGPLGELRDRARSSLELVSAVLGRCRAALGAHREALPLLLATREPDDRTVAALLRSEAAVHGAPAALQRYEAHRVALRERIGSDPGPLLTAVHAELLAADHPVRSGVRFDATSLVGRDDDIRELSALVARCRVTSIVGPGGIGKTRLAHKLGRAATQPVVRVVELVGVAAPDDVLGEVGSVLGVRDSVGAQLALSSQRRHGVRARIAQDLGRAPSLLILDNCEHVVAAVADLVAFLVATVPTVRIVTTSRTPLAIAAESIFPLGQLAEDDAVELFLQRARAARPAAPLPRQEVRQVVARLDGLPLAIELAAAKVRVMSVGDISHRLHDRFSLLRDGDRSAPDRHRTLLAVIDWSWNLLADDDERRALGWLSLFPDGFSLPAAEAVVGEAAARHVPALVDQSLLAVVDTDTGVRYRMLETVREYGARKLTESGQLERARASYLAWATGYAARHARDLHTSGQLVALACLRAEENTLTDLLRDGIARREPATVSLLTVALSGLWWVTGEHERMMVLATAVENLLHGWEPLPGDVDDAVGAACALSFTAVLRTGKGSLPASRLIADYGDQVTRPWLRALVRIIRTFSDADLDASRHRLEQLCDDSDHWVAVLALWLSSHLRENNGDPLAALGFAERALDMARNDDGPWARAEALTQLAVLNGQVGRHRQACRFAREAVPLLDQLDASDDAVRVRTVLACSAIDEGDLDAAQRLLAEVDAASRSRPGGTPWLATIEAELELARGNVRRGLELYRVALAQWGAHVFPGVTGEPGAEPWLLYGEGAAATAYALHGTGDEGLDLFRQLLGRARFVRERPSLRFDYPVAGGVLYGIGAWGLLKDAIDVEDAIRLVVLAKQFGYHQLAPSLAWRHVAGVAERRAPGRLETVTAEYGDRHGPALRDPARDVAARLPTPD